MQFCWNPPNVMHFLFACSISCNNNDQSRRVGQKIMCFNKFLCICCDHNSVQLHLLSAANSGVFVVLCVIAIIITSCNHPNGRLYWHYNLSIDRKCFWLSMVVLLSTFVHNFIYVRFLLTFRHYRWHFYCFRELFYCT